MKLIYNYYCRYIWGQYQEPKILSVEIGNLIGKHIYFDYVGHGTIQESPKMANNNKTICKP